MMINISGKILGILICGLLIHGCAYLQNTFKQAGYESSFKRTNKKAVLKHLLTRDTFYVYGNLKDEDDTYQDYALAVAALTEAGDKNEVVDVTHFARSNSYYGLHLPAGGYRLIVLADLNEDDLYESSEIIAHVPIRLDKKSDPELVASSDIIVTPTIPSHKFYDISIPVRSAAVAKKQSLFYPKGTIRAVDDPLFSRSTATLGMYDPAAFGEVAPMMFYALEEDLPYKVPIVFIHGIEGSITDFLPLLERLDRQRYKPWFFYYPSGADLDKLAQLFYQIFLSGKIIPLDKMPLVVVAHSMGGLIVRKSLNSDAGTSKENDIKLFISIATPFGGHPRAKRGVESAPLVLPSWYDLNPDGDFIHDLYNKPIPKRVEHHLIYAYGNPSKIKLGENSDGVVPLSSQLYTPAQAQSRRQYGYNQGHVSVLSDDSLISQLLKLIYTVKAPAPEAHMNFFFQGGFDVQLSNNYTDIEQYVIYSIGKYLRALSKGWIEPINEYGFHFLAVMNREVEAAYPAESAWLKFKTDYPELATGSEN
ncbi:MAG: alpha/beta hydrolase [Gammaproteobacteria bacterium]|nr:alpha/beta hydrolase [Gammaproteobacteria bacterium]